MSGSSAGTHSQDPVDLDAVELRDRIAAGEIRAEQATSACLERIRRLDQHGPTLRAVLELNPDALEIARELDRELAASGPRGPLHGVPVLVKANVDTADRMATSAGSLALAEHRARSDAPVVAQLRAAGAVLLGKTNLSEWANFRSTRSTSGWSSLGGQTRNPYVLDRSPCGSSSGSAVAVAARLAPLAVGTETDGSIVCPSGVNGVVGLKPTLGRVSQRGIVPVAAGQDTAGPMARSVRGAAMLLESLLEPDPRDREAPKARRDLAGLRIGVVRRYFGAGRQGGVEAAYTIWQASLREAGAELVDPVNPETDADVSAAEREVLLHEFKAGVERYLRSSGAACDSLAALIDFNRRHAARVMPFFDQELFLAAQKTGGLEAPAYADAVARSRVRVRGALESAFATHAVDALVAPANGPAWRRDRVLGDRAVVSSAQLAALSGWPSIAVPASLVSGLPVAIAFIGRPGEERLLLEIAGVFEAARAPFPDPGFLPTLDE